MLVYHTVAMVIGYQLSRITFLKPPPFLLEKLELSVGFLPILGSTVMMTDTLEKKKLFFDLADFFAHVYWQHIEYSQTF